MLAKKMNKEAVTQGNHWDAFGRFQREGDKLAYILTVRATSGDGPGRRVVLSEVNVLMLQNRRRSLTQS